MNPYIKLLGVTDIMSDREKKTSTVSPDQGATGATAIIVPKELESEWLQFLKQREEEKEYNRHMTIIDKDLVKFWKEPTPQEWRLECKQEMKKGGGKEKQKRSIPKEH